MIRSILVILTAVLFLIIGIPIMLIECIIGKFNRRAKDYSCLRMVQFIFKVMLFESGIKLTVIGEENVPKDQAALFIGNHRSYFDVILTYSRMPGLCGFIAKDAFEQVPLLKNWMRALYCLFLDRDNVRSGLKVILKAIEYVKAGVSICVFPEGTRYDGEGMLPFKEGTMKIAEKSGCPIIPMALTGTRDIYENHRPFVRSSRVILEYGEPILVQNLTKEEKKFLGKYTQERIQTMLDRHKTMQ